MKALEYIRQEDIPATSALLIGHLSTNPGANQKSFSDKYDFSRSQASQVFRRCAMKGWIHAATSYVRSRDPAQSFKSYTLTPAGKRHADKINE
jgi:hypothetical protein